MTRGVSEAELEKMIKEAVSINNNPYRNYLCSNSVAGCHFFWQVYYDNESDILVKYHRQMDKYFEPMVSIPLPQTAIPIANPGQTPYGRSKRSLYPPVPPTYMPPSVPPTTEGSADDLPF